MALLKDRMRYTLARYKDMFDLSLFLSGIPLFIKNSTSVEMLMLKYYIICYHINHNQNQGWETREDVNVIFTWAQSSSSRNSFSFLFCFPHTL